MENNLRRRVEKDSFNLARHHEKQISQGEKSAGFVSDGEEINPRQQKRMSVLRSIVKTDQKKMVKMDFPYLPERRKIRDWWDESQSCSSWFPHEPTGKNPQNDSINTEKKFKLIKIKKAGSQHWDFWKNVKSIHY